MKKDVKLMLLNNFGHRCPKWLTDPREKEMTLSRDATESEVDLFLIELLSQNNTDLSRDIVGCFNDFIERSKRGIRLYGGIVFYEGNNRITPGCCNDGIGVYKKVIKEIKESETMIWLGHDPFPVFEYLENEIVVWSDDCLGIWGEPLDRPKVISIKYEKNDLYNKFSKLDEDVKDFLTGPFYERVNHFDSSNSRQLVDILLNWLKIK
jgi:hypothetical protein